MENHSKYNEEIYTRDGHSRLYVNLFIPSSVDWKESGLKLKRNKIPPMKYDSPHNRTYTFCSL